MNTSGKTLEMTDMVQCILRGINQDAIKYFLEEGKKYGTTVEALYEAFTAALTGEACTINEALRIGALEWYK